MIQLESIDETEICIKVNISTIDVLGSFTFEEKTSELISAHPHKNLVIDLTKVRYFSSAVVSVLMMIERRLAQTGHKITLVNASSFIRKVLWLADIDELFQFETSD